VNPLDWNALRAGGSVALVFAIPFSIAARVVADGGGSKGTASLLSLAALVGFVLGCRCGRVDPAAATPAEARPRLRGRHLRHRPGGVHRRPAAPRQRGALAGGAVQPHGRSGCRIDRCGLASLMHRRGFYPSSTRRST
jgi:hypothetical protein